MTCTIIAKYEDQALERDHPGDTAPSFMTPIDYTLETECTVVGCEHPPKLAKHLLLDFNEQGARYTHNGVSYVARPRTEDFKYLGPLDDNPLIRKGTLTMTSKYGWMSIKTTTGKTTASSQGEQAKSGGSVGSPEETGILPSDRGTIQ